MNFNEYKEAVFKARPDVKEEYDKLTGGDYKLDVEDILEFIGVFDQPTREAYVRVLQHASEMGYEVHLVKKFKDGDTKDGDTEEVSF